MDDRLLTLNAGSSSIKYALYTRDESRFVCGGQVGNVGVGPACDANP